MTPYRPLPFPGVRMSPEEIQSDVAQMHRDAFAYAPAAQAVEAGVPYPAPGVHGSGSGLFRSVDGAEWVSARSAPEPALVAGATVGASYGGGAPAAGSGGGFGGCGVLNRGSSTMVVTRQSGGPGPGDGSGVGPGGPGGGGRGPGPPPFRGGGWMLGGGGPPGGGDPDSDDGGGDPFGGGGPGPGVPARVPGGSPGN